MSSADESVSRINSVKRVRSISASLKGLFRPVGSGESHKGKEHHESTPKPEIAPVRTHEVNRRKSVNENYNSKLSKISNEKVMELHKTRGNTSGIPTPINKTKFYLSDKDVSTAGSTLHSAKVSPLPKPVDMSPMQSPLPNIRNTFFSSHNSKMNGSNTVIKDSANISPVTSADDMVRSPMSPLNLPNLSKLSLSEIPSNLLAPEDTLLSENDYIDTRTDLDDHFINTSNNRKNVKDDTESESTDSVAATPTDITIDKMLENNYNHNKADTHLRPNRSRSLHKTLSAASSIQSSVSSVLSNENLAKVDDKKSNMKYRNHAESFGASNIPRFQHNHSGNNSSVKSKEDLNNNITCILQIDNFKVFSNGTHEHNLKMINLVNCDGKTKSGGGVGVFSIAGFFKSSHKNVENVDNIEFERPNFDNAISLIPSNLNNFDSDSSDDNSSSNSNNNNNQDEKEIRDKKKKTDKNLPEIINPKAAVSSEELKLITTLSERIHLGLKNAKRNKKDETKSDSHHHHHNSNHTNGECNVNLDIASGDRFLDKYGKHLGIVGHGSYGIVSVSTRLVNSKDIGRLPTYCKDNKLYFGVKQLKPRNNESAEKFSTKITSEFIIGHSLSRPHKKGDKVSPNILKILDLLEDNNKFVEVMEFCPSGDLYSLLTRRYKNGSALHPLEADCFMKQLLHGIKYMHDRGVAHCDLKPENILFHPNGLLKIADFGTSCVFQTAWEKHVHFQAGAMGSEPYVAPEEFIKGNDYDPRLADCWSIGVVYCTMVLGRCLWKIAIREKDGFYNSFIEEMVNEKEFYVFEELRHINHDINRMRRVVLYKIFHWNPEKRISINQILQSSWMKRTRCCIPYKI